MKKTNKTKSKSRKKKKWSSPRLVVLSEVDYAKETIIYAQYGGHGGGGSGGHQAGGRQNSMRFHCEM